jgi:RNA polymerase sigma-70 factor, ECF subfamily
MTDEEMVAAYVESGDSEALEQLISRHFDSIRRLAFSMLLNDVDADDAVQEVFVRVVQGVKTFRREAAFSTWLHRVALNTIYGIISRKKRRPALLGSASEATSSDHRTAESDLAFLELDQAIQAALADLSPELRAALVMTTFEGRGRIGSTSGPTL